MTDRNKMIEDNIGLVPYCMKHTKIPKCFTKQDMEDLQQDGMIALINAVDRYKEGHTFSTFATQAIKRALWRSISKKMKNYNNCVEYNEQETEGYTNDDFTLLVDVKSLTSNEKSILYLKYKYNMTLGEIAEVLGFSKSNAQRLHERALKKIKKEL